jgi:hypothetical protein
VKRNAGQPNQGNQDRNAPGSDRQGSRDYQNRPGDEPLRDRESQPGDLDVDEAEDEEFEEEDEGMDDDGRGNRGVE